MDTKKLKQRLYYLKNIEKYKEYYIKNKNKIIQYSKEYKRNLSNKIILKIPNDEFNVKKGLFIVSFD